MFVRAKEERIQSSRRLAQITSYERKVHQRTHAVLAQRGRKRLKRVKDRARLVSSEQPRRLPNLRLRQSGRPLHLDHIERPQTVL